jgi:RimJ/RimL family protein N-acetyltransferase
VQVDDELEGDGLRLRPLRQGREGVAFLLRMTADAQARQWSRSLRRIGSEADAVAWIDERLAAAGTYEWLVTDSATGQLLGRAGLHRGSADEDLEVGYWTLPEARGNRVASRATRLIARYGHERLGEARVALLHAVANRASCRAALAASFRQEGAPRAFLDHGDGIRWDAHVHARLAADPWDALPRPLVPVELTEVVGEDVVLRPWQIELAPALAAIATDPAMRAWSSLPQGGEQDAVTWVREAQGSDDALPWAIHDATTGELLGGIALHQLDPTNSRCEVGYWVAPYARGRGVASRAVRAATTHAFDQVGVERVVLYHAVENLASCGVARNAGFALEGTMRRGYRYPDGELHDEHIHARLRDDI